MPSHGATMDFFGQQTRTRRRTVVLALLLALAVGVIVGVVYPIFAFLVAWVGPHGGAGDRDPDWEKMWAMMWQWEMVIGVSLGVLALVIGATMYKIYQLARRGGAGIAELLGGTLVTADTQDPDERKLLNVVEEMAIASGMSVPPVYIMNEESGINAFAAGFTPEDAVIGVTRGAVVYLSRDELQGVVAHEFSHVLNGDMRLNLRLIGIVHGLMVIALIGYGMLAAAGSRRRRSYRSRDEGKGRAAIALIGVVLIAVGMTGVFFGRLIKAAISRQREFLADAAAVQFTRNPAGLAGALQKIGAHKRHGRISGSQAEEASHMFFGRAVAGGSILDSHPSLKQRIRRIDPSWDGTFPELKAPFASDAEASDQQTDTEQEDQQQQSSGPLGGIEGADFARVAVTGAVLAGAAATQQRAKEARGADVAQNALAQVGEPTAAHLEHARELRAAIPDELIAAVQETGGGRALVYALLLHDDEDVRAAQWRRLEEHAEAAAYERTRQLAPMVAELPRETRLPMIDLAMPAMRQLTPEQYTGFRENMNQLIRADRRVSLFEWMMRRVVVHRLEPQITGADRPRTRYYNLRQLGKPVGGLLSTLAYLGAADEQEARQMFDAGVSVLDIDPPTMWDTGDCNLDAVGEALDRLAEVALRHKRTLLTACATCIAANQRVTAREAELLRAISDSLDVPMPPLLPGQPLA